MPVAAWAVAAGAVAPGADAVMTAHIELPELDPEACAATARRRFSPGVMAAGYERLYAELLTRTATRAPGAVAAQSVSANPRMSRTAAL